MKRERVDRFANICTWCSLFCFWLACYLCYSIYEILHAFDMMKEGKVGMQRWPRIGTTWFNCVMANICSKCVQNQRVYSKDDFVGYPHFVCHRLLACQLTQTCIWTVVSSFRFISLSYTFVAFDVHSHDRIKPFIRFCTIIAWLPLVLYYVPFNTLFDIVLVVILFRSTKCKSISCESIVTR